MSIIHMRTGKAIFILLSLLFIYMAIKKNAEEVKAAVKAKKNKRTRYPLLHHAVAKNPTYYRTSTTSQSQPPSCKKINFDPHQHA